MTAMSIKLTGGASEQEVISLAKATLEARGYLWEPKGPLSARAHQGGRPLDSNLAKTKKLLLAVDVDAEGEQLRLRRIRYRWAWLMAVGGLVPASVNNEFQHVGEQMTAALRRAHLAT